MADGTVIQYDDDTARELDDQPRLPRWWLVARR